MREVVFPTMPNVIFYEVFAEEEEELKKQLPKNIFAQFTWKTIQEAGHAKPPAEVICIRTQSQIPSAWASQIKGILARSRGYDHLFAFQKASGIKIPCGYLEEYCSRAVAEHAIMTAMILLRKFKSQLKSFETFDRNGLTGKECLERRALVVGVGHIGKEIVQLAQALGMDVKGVDSDPREKDVKYVSLDQGIVWADVILCAAALTSETKGMLNYPLLKKAKPGLILINIARGEITPIEDLKKLLDEQHLHGLALDVFPEEGALANALRAGKSSKSKGHQIILDLRDHDNVIFTPHNAFNTQESLQEKCRFTIKSLQTFFQTRRFPQSLPL